MSRVSNHPNPTGLAHVAFRFRCQAKWLRQISPHLKLSELLVKQPIFL